jgi:hypothetical protein
MLIPAVWTAFEDLLTYGMKFVPPVYKVDEIAVL